MFLAPAGPLELRCDVGELLLPDLLLVGSFGLLHVPVDERLRRIEDFVSFPFAASRDGLGALLEEMQRLPLSLFTIEVSDKMNLQLKKGISLSFCHHSSVTATVSCWIPSDAASKRTLFECAIIALTLSS